MLDYSYLKLKDKLKTNGLNLRRIPVKEIQSRVRFNAPDTMDFESILIWLAIKKKSAGKEIVEKYYFEEIISYQYKIRSEKEIEEESKKITDKPSRRNFEIFMREDRDYTMLLNKTEWRENVLSEIIKIAPEYIGYDNEEDPSTGYLNLMLLQW